MPDDDAAAEAQWAWEEQREAPGPGAPVDPVEAGSHEDAPSAAGAASPRRDRAQGAGRPHPKPKRATTAEQGSFFGRPPPKPKAPRKPNHAHRLVVHFAEERTRRKLTAPLMTHGRDYKAAKDIVAAARALMAQIDEAKRIVDPDGFLEAVLETFVRLAFEDDWVSEQDAPALYHAASAGERLFRQIREMIYEQNR